MTKAPAFGMRCVPRLARAAALAAFAGTTLAGAAAAQEFCAGLRQAMAHAADDFRSLIIAGERALGGAAPARTLLPDGNRCEVRESRSIVEYRCRMTALDAPSSGVRAAYRREVARMRRCFAGLVPRGDGDYTGNVEWTGAVIWEVKPGLRAAVVFVTADEVAQAAIAHAASSGEGEPPEEANAVWVVVDKKRR
jgi:hypothetical protein